MNNEFQVGDLVKHRLLNGVYEVLRTSVSPYYRTQDIVVEIDGREFIARSCNFTLIHDRFDRILALV